MPFFSKVFRGRDGGKQRKNPAFDAASQPPPKPRWEEAWSRTEIAPIEVQELIHQCTLEMKSRGKPPLPTIRLQLLTPIVA